MDTGDELLQETQIQSIDCGARVSVWILKLH